MILKKFSLQETYRNNGSETLELIRARRTHFTLLSLIDKPSVRNFEFALIAQTHHLFPIRIRSCSTSRLPKNETFLLVAAAAVTNPSVRHTFPVLTAHKHGHAWHSCVRFCAYPPFFTELQGAFFFKKNSYNNVLKKTVRQKNNKEVRKTEKNDVQCLQKTLLLMDGERRQVFSLRKERNKWRVARVREKLCL